MGSIVRWWVAVGNRIKEAFTSKIEAIQEKIDTRVKSDKTR